MTILIKRNDSIFVIDEISIASRTVYLERVFVNNDSGAIDRKPMTTKGVMSNEPFLPPQTYNVTNAYDWAINILVEKGICYRTKSLHSKQYFESPATEIEFNTIIAHDPDSFRRAVEVFAQQGLLFVEFPTISQAIKHEKISRLDLFLALAPKDLIVKTKGEGDR